MADICFFDMLEYILAKAIDTCTLKMYLNPYQFCRSINRYTYLCIVSYVSSVGLKLKATVLKKMTIYQRIKQSAGNFLV